MAQPREEKLRKQREAMKRLAEERMAAGTCRQCGQPLHPKSGSHCALHLVQNRIKQRERQGSEPWHPGGKGRPPLEVS